MSNILANKKLNLQLIKDNLTTQYIGQSFYYREEIDSTNTFAKGEAISLKDGCVVLCDEQTSGHGRRNRYWYSIPYKSVCMSVILKPNIMPVKAPRFTIAAAVSLCEALSDYFDDVGIKWPNDIIINHKKVAGILLDCTIEGNVVKYVIVGMGINVNTPCFENDLRETATSLYCESGSEFSREHIIAKVINSLEENVDLVYSDIGFKFLMQKYKEKSYVLGKAVCIIGASTQTEGEVHGFDEHGQIQLINKFGNIVTFNSGDVSLRY